ncbi:hypothetical protein F5Y17DRAFT_439840 [Xylariaceae sp. FL0594]|nr:hypothetical protein F5Y17DRAFT_439840 [Xylariaceae sp. FL0594]
MKEPVTKMTSPVWSRFVRFIADDGRTLAGEPVDGDVDVGLELAAGRPVSAKVLDGTSALDDEAKFTGAVATIKKLLSPISAQEIGTIRCIGMNYKDHVKEMGCTTPQVPEVFMKPSTCLLDPCEPIVLPKSAPSAVDGECELAIVISKTCKNVPRAKALDYVLGYTLANDVTARDVQAGISQWGYCKGYDSFLPLGPVLVSRQGMRAADASDLDLKTTVGGKTLQDGSTRDLIFGVEEIIEYISKGTTLPKGTVILTGTPAGIGHSHNPPLYLRPGVEVRLSISGGIGTLTNEVVAEA